MTGENVTDRLVALLSYSLILMAVGPLLLLGVYVIADWAGWRFADRILEMLGPAFVYQMVLAGLINLILGIALMALGVWAMLDTALAWRLLAGLLTILLGVWRAWQGAIILWGWHRAR